MKNKILLGAFLSLTLSTQLFAEELANNEISPSSSITTTNIENQNKENSSLEVVNNITFLNNDVDLKEYLKKETDKPTFIFVYASWCGWCKKERPILEQIAPKRSDVNIVAINYETAPDMVKTYNVKGYPSFITIKDDKFTKEAGFMPKSDLNSFISDNIKKVNKKNKISY